MGNPEDTDKIKAAAYDLGTALLNAATNSMYAIIGKLPPEAKETANAIFDWFGTDTK